MGGCSKCRHAPYGCAACTPSFVRRRDRGVQAARLQRGAAELPSASSLPTLPPAAERALAPPPAAELEHAPPAAELEPALSPAQPRASSSPAAELEYVPPPASSPRAAVLDLELAMPSASVSPVAEPQEDAFRVCTTSSVNLTELSASNRLSSSAFELSCCDVPIWLAAGTTVCFRGVRLISPC